MRDLRKPPTPWLFSLLIVPLGIVVAGFDFTAFPLLLAQTGVPVDRIASISSIINLPGVIGFLFAPVVDIKFRRRTWLVFASFGISLFACLYFPLIGASHLALMAALILAGALITFLVAAACGGLIVKTLSESAQSKAAAWIMAGQLGGGALGAAVMGISSVPSKRASIAIFQAWSKVSPASSSFAFKVPANPAFCRTAGTHQMGKCSAVVSFLIGDWRCLTNDRCRVCPPLRTLCSEQCQLLGNTVADRTIQESG